MKATKKAGHITGLEDLRQVAQIVKTPAAADSRHTVPRPVRQRATSHSGSVQPGPTDAETGRSGSAPLRRTPPASKRDAARLLPEHRAPPRF